MTVRMHLHRQIPECIARYANLEGNSGEGSGGEGGAAMYVIAGSQVRVLRWAKSFWGLGELIFNT